MTSHPVPWTSPDPTTIRVRGGYEVVPARFVAGSLLAAATSAAVAFVAAWLVEAIFSVDLVLPEAILPDASSPRAFATAAALTALAASGALWLLVASVSAPRLYFGWLMLVAVVMIAVWPLTRGDEVVSAAFTSVVHLLAALTAWTAVSAVAASALRPAPSVR